MYAMWKYHQETKQIYKRIDKHAKLPLLSEENTKIAIGAQKLTSDSQKPH